MKNPTAAPLPEQQALTAQEQSLLLAYRAMDQRRKRENLALLEDDAKEYPRYAAPTLRLISAAGTAVRP